jgi:hypothetical protein
LLVTHLPAPIAARVASRASGSGSDARAKLPLEAAVPGYVVPDAAELRAAIAHFDGNVRRVAAYFGRDRKQIYRWAQQYDIDLTALRADGT